MSQTKLNDNDFNRYKTIKSKFRIHYKGYNLQNLIAHDIARFTFNKKFPKIKSVIRFFVVPHPSFFINLVNRDHILISNLYNEREDYRNFIQEIRDEIDQPTKIIEYAKNKRFRYVLNFQNILSSIKSILNNRIFLSWKEILYYSASLIYYKNFLDSLETFISLNINIKAFIAFNSSGTPDNVFTLFFKKNNVPTFTLQHGAMVNYKRIIPADIINIENMTANKMLCWGQDTVDIMQSFGYRKERLVKVGNPKYKNIEIKKVKQTFLSCIVLLGRWIYDEENFLLLNVLNQYIKGNEKIRFTVKPHPSLNIEKYKEYLKMDGFSFIEKEELLTNLFNSGEYDFAITYNTTAYYESMIVGIPSLRYSLNENEELKGLNDKFTTIEELDEIIKYFKGESPSILKNEFESVLNNFFGYKNIRYNEVFYDLIK